METSPDPSPQGGPAAAPARKRHVGFSAAGLRRGWADAMPMAVGVGAYALTFGLLASDAGLSALEAIVMSTLVYSGSAQVATVGSLAAGLSLLAAAATVLMLNARYMLYGAALRPWLGRASVPQAYGSLYFLGDGNWLLSMKAHAEGENDAAYVFGSGIAMFLPWIGGTLLGSLVGQWVAEPRLLALDFLLVAFCAAMAVGLYKSRSDLWPAGAALAVALAADFIAPSGWTIVAAGLAGAAIAYWRHGSEDAEEMP